MRRSVVRQCSSGRHGGDRRPCARDRLEYRLPLWRAAAPPRRLHVLGGENTPFSGALPLSPPPAARGPPPASAPPPPPPLPPPPHRRRLGPPSPQPSSGPAPTRQ